MCIRRMSQKCGCKQISRFDLAFMSWQRLQFALNIFRIPIYPWSSSQWLHLSRARVDLRCQTGGNLSGLRPNACGFVKGFPWYLLPYQPPVQPTTARRARIPLTGKPPLTPQPRLQKWWPWGRMSKTATQPLSRGEYMNPNDCIDHPTIGYVIYV